MVWYAEQNNRLKPARGTLGTSSICVPTLAGFFIGDSQMKRIPLSQGKYALVDDEDYDRLNQWKWFAGKDYNTFYARRNKGLNDKKSIPISMHREILNLKCGDGKMADHIDHNGLNNQRANLRLCTNAQNQWNHRFHYKGIFKHQNNKWVARIWNNGKRLYLGMFDKQAEAKAAYQKAHKSRQQETLKSGKE